MAILTTSEFNEFATKIDILESKGHELSFTVDRTQDGNFDVKLLTDFTMDELDALTEQ